MADPSTPLQHHTPSVLTSFPHTSTRSCWPRCLVPACPLGSTPLEEDEALLHGQAGAELLAADPRQHAAAAYRVERKRLLAKTGALLRAYAKGAKAG